jgi:hypothetical protein
LGYWNQMLRRWELEIRSVLVVLFPSRGSRRLGRILYIYIFVWVCVKRGVFAKDLWREKLAASRVRPLFCGGFKISAVAAVCEATTRKKAQDLVFLEVPRAGIYFLGISHGSEHVVPVTFNLDPCDSCWKTRRVCLAFYQNCKTPRCFLPVCGLLRISSDLM